VSTSALKRWSEWAQQDSNLRPLGDQRTVYTGCRNPTDQAIQGTAVYPRVPGCTSKTDDKVTVDHGRRVVRSRRSRVIDALGVAALFPLFYVAALILDRQDRKAGVR
jgi:hypothetical protein